MNGEDEGDEVVRYRLSVPVQRVESQGGERGGDWVNGGERRQNMNMNMKEQNRSKREARGDSPTHL
jgi:hypothetical protein